MFLANLEISDRIARIGVGLALIGFALGLITAGTSWTWVG